MCYEIQWLMKRVLTEIVAMAGVDKFSGCDWRQITCHHSGETEASHQHNGSSVDIYISIHSTKIQRYLLSIHSIHTRTRTFR